MLLVAGQRKNNNKETTNILWVERINEKENKKGPENMEIYKVMSPIKHSKTMG